MLGGAGDCRQGDEGDKGDKEISARDFTLLLEFAPSNQIGNMMPPPGLGPLRLGQVYPVLSRSSL